MLSTEDIRTFRKVVYEYYENHRRELPWRKTYDPYCIIVSEVMLQQTQVARVIGKYTQFVRAFPDIQTLADAPLRDILMMWQGLGYNRRALALKKIAETLMISHKGKIPSDVKVLKALPGIGNATAHAVCAFAFEKPVVFIETNIRTVFIHHFFKSQKAVRDAEILPFVAETLDASNPRLWYYALMDYGVALKKAYVNPGRNSASYRKQGPFIGSNRQVRGRILQALIKQPRVSEECLIKQIHSNADAIRNNLKQLVREGLVTRKGDCFSIV